MAIRFCLLFCLALSGCMLGAVEKNTRLSDIHHRLGVNELHNGRAHLALKELLLSLKHDPENADAHYTLAFLFQGRRDFDKAIEHLKQALALRADFADAHNNLGTVLLELGRIDEAIASFKRALGILAYPTPYLAHGNIGWALYKRGDLRNAVIRRPHTSAAAMISSRLVPGFGNLVAAMTEASSKWPASR